MQDTPQFTLSVFLLLLSFLFYCEGNLGTFVLIKEKNSQEVFERFPEKFVHRTSPAAIFFHLFRAIVSEEF
jgi:hypothetical protein